MQINTERVAFKNGYEDNWSEEILKIQRVILGDPAVYVMYDFADEIIEGTFYEEEIKKE